MARANETLSGIQDFPLTMGVTILVDLKEYLVSEGEKRKVETKRQRAISTMSIGMHR